MFLHCDPRAATVSRSAIRQDSFGVELSFQLSPTTNKSRQHGTNQTTTLLHKLQRLFLAQIAHTGKATTSVRLHNSATEPSAPSAY